MDTVAKRFAMLNFGGGACLGDVLPQAHAVLDPHDAFLLLDLYPAAVAGGITLPRRWACADQAEPVPWYVW